MLSIKANTSDIARLGNVFAAAGKDGPKALMQGINAAGDKSRTGMRRALVSQTGLKYGVFVRAVKSTKAYGSNYSYTIYSKGGNVRLKFFRPKETKAGVRASPWNHTKVYPSTFMKGGRFPKRKKLDLNGQVFRRVGKARNPFKVVRSGLEIPTEMITGASASTFYRIAGHELPLLIEKKLFNFIK